MGSIRQLQNSPAPRGPAAKPARRAASARAASSPRHGLAPVSPRHTLAPANGLPEPLKTNIEAMSGLAMDDVRVHRNSSEPAALGALAFTQGTEIHLGATQEQHLPHEAWHVVQQKQGRVTATRQLKGVAINDDAALEREADTMTAVAAGMTAAGFAGPGPPGSGSCSAAGIVQRRVDRLTPARIEEIAQNPDPSFDSPADYIEFLQGLWESSASRRLYVRVGSVIPASGVAMRPSDLESIFVLAEDLPTGDGGPGSPRLWTEDEVEIPSIELDRRYAGFPNNLARLREDIAFAMLTGGLDDLETQSEYGAIDFRFTGSEGVLYLADTNLDAAAEQRRALAVERRLTVTPTNSAALSRMGALYKAAGYPYPEERVGLQWLYVPAHLSVEFEALQRAGGPTREPGALAGRSNLQGVPAVPGGAKVATFAYSHSALRASRGAGQSAVMRASAGQYAESFGGHGRRWEWLHLRASRLGGRNTAENLVAGTEQANTQMIPYERMIYRLAKNAKRERQLRVTWTCNLLSVDGQPTHIADTIRFTAAWEGRAAASDEERSLDAQASVVNGTMVKGTEGASFTKLDRDFAEARFAAAGAAAAAAEPAAAARDEQMAGEEVRDIVAPPPVGDGGRTAAIDRGMGAEHEADQEFGGAPPPRRERERERDRSLDRARIGRRSRSRSRSRERDRDRDRGAARRERDEEPRGRRSEREEIEHELNLLRAGPAAAQGPAQADRRRIDRLEARLLELRR